MQFLSPHPTNEGVDMALEPRRWLYLVSVNLGYFVTMFAHRIICSLYLELFCNF